MPSSPDIDAWVQDVFGVNVASPEPNAPAPPAGASGDVTASPPPSSAGQGEGDLATPVTAEGGGTSTEPTTAPSSNAAPPPETPPTLPQLALITETEARNPTNRARTKLGVGERVTLQASRGPGQWTTTGGTLSSRFGTKITLTAPDRPGNAKVTVQIGADSADITFTVIAPSSVVMVRLSTEHYNLGVPNAGMRTQIYVGPADVNFGAITFTEDEVGATATGCWAPKNGEGHSPNASPLGFFDIVASGKGTKAAATDHCWTGYIPAQQTAPLTNWTGAMAWPIRWHWQCGSGTGVITTVTQQVNTSADGTTEISKAGASFSAALS